VDVDEGETIGAPAPEGPVGVVLGVARPERVLDSITPDVVFRAFRPDHHWWELAEVRTLAEEAKRRGAKALLTTRKDAVKMLGWRKAGSFELALPLFASRIETEVLDRPELDALLDRLSAP
jgi:tetraacyldisaccharide-1-P 4'-kinase